MHISLVDKHYPPDFSSRSLWYRHFKLQSYSIKAQRIPILSCAQTWTQAQQRPPTHLPYSAQDSPRKDTELFVLPVVSHKSFTRRADNGVWKWGGERHKVPGAVHLASKCALGYPMKYNL